MININVKISQEQTQYPIYITQDKIENLKTKILSDLGEKRFLVVISERVNKLYEKFLGFKNSEKFILRDGEKEKNFKNYKKILDRLQKQNFTRNDVIIAIGGGVVGDIAGFAAATYMRGIDYVQVPTTLLACVDSSVGGKVAIDTNFGKNLVGCFYQPKAVYINLNFLKTLDNRQYKSGLGEVVKYAFIENSCGCNEKFELSNFLQENSEKINNRNISTLERLIEYCIKLKISVVENDEKEKGLRKILNFGHTYGHAIEKYTNYKFTHGESVVKGINFAFILAEKLGRIDKNYLYLAKDLLNKFDFRQIPDYPVNKLVKIMQMDKKFKNGNLAFILPDDFSSVGEVLLSLENFCRL